MAQGDLRVDGPIDAVRDAVAAYAHEAQWSPQPSDGAHVLAYKVSTSVWSWGQKVTVTLAPDGDATRVDVTTKPAGLQLYDWGQGKGIVRSLLTALGDASEPAPDTAPEPG